MTLICYLSRVHFADGVLEVALSSELELNKLSNALLVVEQTTANCDFSERVVSGLPFWCKFNLHEIPAKLDLQHATASLLQHLHDVRPDVVIAFGSSLALSIADTCCRQHRLHTTDHNDRKSAFPKLIAIPGVDGVPSISVQRNDSALTAGFGSGIQPTAIIVDPTLIMGESIERTSCAIADTLARCLSAHFSDAYNPPADGIALDGVKRILRNLSALIEEDSLEMRRELMAASLNGTLAMQKETGISHELCNILLQAPPTSVNKGALMRLLILFEVEFLERSWSQIRRKEVCVALGVPSGTSLREWLSSIMETLPLPGSLSRMGFSDEHISSAAEELAASRANKPSAQTLSDMLNDIRLQYRDLQAVSESG